MSFLFYVYAPLSQNTILVKIVCVGVCVCVCVQEEFDILGIFSSDQCHCRIFTRTFNRIFWCLLYFPSKNFYGYLLFIDGVVRAHFGTQSTNIRIEE